MKQLDKNYLSLQFKNKMYSKNGNEFQSFFENIMERAFSDFQKIRPYGKEGDGGSDGYRKSAGIYYQVYAPNTPAIKDAIAANKLKGDFQKLQTKWSKISEIREYYFVFNDKYLGSSILIERAISDLKEDNPNIQFDTLLARKLEDIFFMLKDVDILSLNFNIDHLSAVSQAYEFLNKIEIELDRECAKSASKMFESINDIISNLKDDSLLLELELIESKCLQKLERIEEAKKKYESISIRYPNDPRSFLNMAEIFLQHDDFCKNKELLDKIEKINPVFWLLKLEKLVRQSHLGENINIDKIDEQEFPSNPRIKSIFYRLYAQFLAESGDNIKAFSFVEKAIRLNSDSFSNYNTKLDIIGREFFLDVTKFFPTEKLQKFLAEIEKVETIFGEFGDIGDRNKAILNIKKIKTFYALENSNNVRKVFEETFDLLLNCYFNRPVDSLLVSLLISVRLHIKYFNKLLKYLDDSSKEISDELSNILIMNFNLNNNLIPDGKNFFQKKHKQKYIDFIYNIENGNFKSILNNLENDIRFAITLANSLKNFPELREKITEALPNNKSIQKEKLLLLLNYEKGDLKKAFEGIKKLDLSNLNYFECKPILKIVHEQQAWDFEIIILEKLLLKEKNIKDIVDLKLQLFNANGRLNNHLEVIRLGEEILEENLKQNFLDENDKENLLAQVCTSHLKRNQYSQAKGIIEKFITEQPKFDFTISIVVEIYLKNKDHSRALEEIIECVKRKKTLIQEDYANLFWYLNQIENSTDFDLKPLDKIKNNSFVKLKNQDRWYFIGDDNNLDASKILSSNYKYPLFIGKQINDKIVVAKKYSSEINEDFVEFIFSIEKYIFWQSLTNFQNLTREERLEGALAVEIPTKNGIIDTKYLEALLKDLDSEKKSFFDLYCKNNFPLALLAVSEGGLTNAIGRIQNEKKGFINFSSGNIEELTYQKQIAKKVIDNKLPFYVDGTSALILAEFGLLKKVYDHISNLKIPQSVINLLIDTTEKFIDIPGQLGYLGYVRGKIVGSSLDSEIKNALKTKFKESIKILESKPENIVTISLANKVDCFSERKIPGELCDACILSQNEHIPVLTEDFLYLKMNKIETEKQSPEYFSCLVMLELLLEQKKISFDDYLDFFGFLSSYRFRFLALNSNDIENAVFGVSKIKSIKTRNIQKLNFPLILSEEYGVTFKIAFNVVIAFFVKVIKDDTILPDVVEKIFVEIIESFPSKFNKKTIGQIFLEVSNELINKSPSAFILYASSKLSEEKINKLWNLLEIYF